MGAPTTDHGHPSAGQRESLYQRAQAGTLTVDLTINPTKEAYKL